MWDYVPQRETEYMGPGSNLRRWIEMHFDNDLFKRGRLIKQING